MKDHLSLWERRGYYSVTWMVWDETYGEIEGAVVGESRPSLHDEDAEYDAVHRAVEEFWKSHQSRAYWVKDGFWFESEAAARKALIVGNKALKGVRK